MFFKNKNHNQNDSGVSVDNSEIVEEEMMQLSHGRTHGYCWSWRNCCIDFYLFFFLLL